MTSASSSTNPRAGFMPMFLFHLKQCWTTMLLFGIILFFVLPVPLMMMISDYDMATAERLLQLKTQIAEDWTSVMRAILVPGMSALSVIVSCARFSYLKNKVSIDFYHSLPIRRGRLFLSQLTVGTVSLAIPYAIALLLALIVVASNGLMSSALLYNVLIMNIEIIIYGLVFYALSTLVGMVSGLTAVHLVLTALAIFIIPCLYISSLAFLDIFTENMWFDYYTSLPVFEYLSPVFRFLGDVYFDSHLTLSESIVMLLAAAGLFAGAYAVYKKRKSERAGTPVVFPILGEIIKYVLVFLGTLLGGLLFFAIMDDLIWTIFGMICGMVLVFMLSNTILQKTAKAMFKGWKGLCIFGVSAAVVFTMLITNVFGINDRIPSPEGTSRATVTFGTAIKEYEFSDIENIEALHSIYSDSFWGFRSYSDAIWNHETLHMNVVFYPKVGIPIAKSVTIYNKSELEEHFRVLLDSEEFKTQHTEHLALLAETSGDLLLSVPRHYYDSKNNQVLRYYNSMHYSYDGTAAENRAQRMVGIDTLLADSTDVSFDYFQQPSIGEIDIYPRQLLQNSQSYSDGYTTIPLLGSMSETIERYKDYGYLMQTPEELIDALVELIDKITVYKTSGENPGSISITGKNQIRQILEASANPVGNAHGALTFVDTEYYAVYTLDVTDVNDNYYVEDEFTVSTQSGDAKPVTTSTTTYTDTNEIAFLAGKVPQFVIDKLS